MVQLSIDAIRLRVVISTDYSTRLFCCYGEEKMGFTIEKPGKRLTPHSLDKTKITLFSSMEKRNPKRTKPKRTVSKLREHRITQMIS